MILTGHRDTHFRFLEKLQAGETVLLQARTGVWHRFNPHYSRGFVTKPPRRQARRARGAAREGGILETVCWPTKRRARPPSGLSQRRIGGCSRSIRELCGYKVRDRQIVDSRTTTISTQEDKMRLILVTCYPFHAIVPGGPLRYMIIAETV